MKMPVVSEKRKIFLIVTTVFLWLCTIILVWLCGDLLKDSDVSNSNGLLVFEVILVVIATISVTVCTCISVVSHVEINENGISLKRGSIEVNRFTWNAVFRVETFEAMYYRSVFVRAKYITVLDTNAPSWAYSYRRPPINFGSHNISFAFSDEAFALIKQYYNGEIYN